MGKILYAITLKLKLMGIDVYRFKDYFREKKLFEKDLKTIEKALVGNKDFQISVLKPMLFERNTESGSASGHYFIQDLYVAKRIFQHNPTKHVDIGSRVDGFIAHLAVFRGVEVLDIRKQTSNVTNILFKQADLMQMPAEMHNYTDSLSCLHAIEHFGLGRYGDPIDIDGHLKALKNMHKILKKDGIFYFSTPIGKQRIEFNAHRVFSPAYLLKKFSEEYELLRFSYIDDIGRFFEDHKLTQQDLENDLGCQYGCGIFELRKK
jgi:SAM-dependent methyltransferase